MTRGGALWALGTWAHPTAENDGSAWPTPQVVDLPNKNAHIKRWGGLNSLTTMAEAKGWPTPEAHSGGHSGEGYGPNIREAVEQWGVGRQAQGIETPGQESSPTDQTLPPQSARRLNPRFVEWLQGFPVGWTERSA